MIYHYKPENECETDEKCFIIEMLPASADEGCSIAQARVMPGVTTTLHKVLGVVERYVILSGEGLVTVGDSAPEKVSVKDIVSIDKDVPQKIENTSGTEDLVFLCVCTPGFNIENYVDLEC
ncbi:MAG: cupin [Moraxellaceae bacterium]|nr:MAG: cupin [Moraxellaceae bacterium]